MMSSRSALFVFRLFFSEFPIGRNKVRDLQFYWRWRRIVSAVCLIKTGSGIKILLGDAYNIPQDMPDEKMGSQDA